MQITVQCRTCFTPVHYAPDGMKVVVQHDDETITGHPAVPDDPGVDAVQHLADQLATAQLALSIGGHSSMLLPILLPVQSAFTKVVQFAQMADDGVIPGVNGRVDARLVALLASSAEEVPDDLSGLE
jgi:hypothetical protein